MSLAGRRLEPPVKARKSCSISCLTMIMRLSSFGSLRTVSNATTPSRGQCLNTEYLQFGTGDPKEVAARFGEEHQLKEDEVERIVSFLSGLHLT